MKISNSDNTSERDEKTAAQRQKGDGAHASGTQKARDAARDAADAGKEQLETGSARAADSVDDFADAVGSAAGRLDQLNHEGLADYANRMASHLSEMSEKLRQKNVDEVTDDVRRLAEKNPALFVLGSVAVGLGLSRFAKASADKRRMDGIGQDAEWRGAAGDPAAYRVGRGRAAFDEQIKPDETGGGL